MAHTLLTSIDEPDDDETGQEADVVADFSTDTFGLRKEDVSLRKLDIMVGDDLDDNRQHSSDSSNWTPTEDSDNGSGEALPLLDAAAEVDEYSTIAHRRRLAQRRKCRDWRRVWHPVRLCFVPK